MCVVLRGGAERVTEREIETGEGKGDREGGRKGGREGGGRRKRDSVKLQILFLIRSFQVNATPESSLS